VFERTATVIDATRAAIADPTDTAQVFRIAEAMSFGNPERLLRRVRRDESGARLLARRDDLLGALCHRDALEAMAPGSLGRAYLAFIDREGITADGLVAASEVASPTGDGDLDFVRGRMRDSHDLWHTVTGYQGDLLGEAALLAFTFAQTGHPGIGFIAALAFTLSPLHGARRFITAGFTRGRGTRWLPSVDWVSMLPRPLADARAALGVVPVGDYEQVRELHRPFVWRDRDHNQ
jgi:ubiquinone biosynthesis protein COQ4